MKSKLKPVIEVVAKFAYELISLAAMASGRLLASNSGQGSCLLVRTDAIGDFTIWAQSAPALVEHFKQKKQIILIVQECNAELARDLNLFDQIWPINIRRFTRNPLYRYLFLVNIRSKGFHTAIDLIFSRLKLIDATLIRATQAPVKIGLRGDKANMTERDYLRSNRWYTELIDLSKDNTHELTRNLELSQILSSKKSELSSPFAKLPTQLPEEIEAPYIVIFPGAKQAYRCWPANRYSKVIDNLYEQHGINSVICGAPSDSGLAQKIQNDCHFNSVIDLTGKTSLTQLFSIISSAAFVVSNETSAAHIAAATSTVCFCITGGGHFGRFVPYPSTGLPSYISPPQVINQNMACYGCNWICKYKIERNHPYPCIEKISTEMVVETIEKHYNFDRR